MYQVIIVVHVLLGLGVIGFVLIQQGKGADAGAAFGSASSGSVFGAQGASSFLSRTTAILATLFFSTSLGLAVLSGYQDGEIDLMETPEIEEVFEDVPLVNGSESAPSFDDLPVSVEDSVSDVVNATVKDVQTAVDSAEETSQDLVNGAKTAVSEEIDKVLDQ